MSYLKQVIKVRARCTMETPDFLRLEGDDFNVIVPRFRVCVLSWPVDRAEVRDFLIDAAYRNAHQLKGCAFETNWRHAKKQEEKIHGQAG